MVSERALLVYRRALHILYITVNRPKPISHYIISTMITSLLDKTGVRVANQVYQRTELMQCHGFRKFFKTTCINAGMNPLYSEYVMGNRSDLTFSKDIL